MLRLDVVGEVVESAVTFGPGLLLTHDCTLDKPHSKRLPTTPAVSRIAFSPIQSLTSLDEQGARSLRGAAGKVQPYEAFYLGELPGFGECFVLLSDVLTVPASYFHVTLREVEQEGQVQMSLFASANGERLGRLDAAHRELLHDKWNALWTRRLART
jgi:hypothetical protein